MSERMLNIPPEVRVVGDTLYVPRKRMLTHARRSWRRR
jgi:hypothetical protein